MGAESFFAEDEYQIGHSVRINDDNNAKLAFTPTTNGTSTDVFTISFWFKRGKLGHAQYLFDIDETTISFNDDDFLFGNLRGTASGNYFWTTNAVFRDLSAWYHIVGAYDSTQGTDTNRFKLYVNGVQSTFSSIDYMPQNREMKDTQTHYIGYEGSGYSADGCFAEVNFVDGLAIGPEFFGMTSDFAEEWLPIQYTGVYGINGFYLNFSGEGTLLATGGTITTDGDYKVHSFTSSGTFTPTIVPASGGFVEYLVIAGGGSGGGEIAGGGGAGGHLSGYLEVTKTGIAVTVGAGGAQRGATENPDAGNNGANSVFSGVTAIGGGGGGGPTGGFAIGRVGGSGGGTYAGSDTNGAAGTAGQGNRGGAGHGTTGNGQGGGGGGAGAVGTDGAGASNNGTNAAGGAGLSNSITGSAVTRAGGGGGGTWNSSGNFQGGNGGAGGGGEGFGNQFSGYSTNASGTGLAGGANTGGGGGGGGNGGGSNGGAGGSGIVILRYKFQ